MEKIIDWIKSNMLIVGVGIVAIYMLFFNKKARVRRRKRRVMRRQRRMMRRTMTRRY